MIRHLRAAIAKLLGCVIDEHPSDSPVLRMSVLINGTILLDGQRVALSDVQRALERIKGKRGVVWYYRESGGSEPPAEAVEVFKLIVEHKVPLSISTQPDFTDVVDDEGKSQPRK